MPRIFYSRHLPKIWRREECVKDAVSWPEGSVADLGSGFANRRTSGFSGSVFTTRNITELPGIPWIRLGSTPFHISLFCWSNKTLLFSIFSHNICVQAQDQPLCASLPSTSRKSTHVTPADTSRAKPTTSRLYIVVITASLPAVSLT
jgi:hypothetical protein